MQASNQAQSSATASVTPATPAIACSSATCSKR